MYGKKPNAAAPQEQEYDDEYGSEIEEGEVPGYLDSDEEEPLE